MHHSVTGCLGDHDSTRPYTRSFLNWPDSNEDIWDISYPEIKSIPFTATEIPVKFKFKRTVVYYVPGNPLWRWVDYSEYLAGNEDRYGQIPVCRSNKYDVGKWIISNALDSAAKVSVMSLLISSNTPLHYEVKREVIKRIESNRMNSFWNEMGKLFTYTRHILRERNHA